jgi:signal transduction histidine kinase/DNA-binding response OmpR family regulator
MKRFYIIFFALPVLVFILLYFSIWWFTASLGVLMIFILYSFFAVRLDAAESRNEVLESEIEELNMRLENAVVKEQKTSKDADQIRQMKQQLLSILSHEIRTPMNGVLGTSLLLSDTTLTAEQQDYVNTIRSCSESLLTTVNNMLVNDLLDFSKMQQEGKQLEYKSFDVRDAIEEILEMFADKSGQSGVDMIYDIDKKVPDQILGDNKRVRQVLMNLVENAVKFTAHGEIFVGLSFIEQQTGGYPPELRFEVRDTGYGMNKEQVKHLFSGIPGKDFQKEGDGDRGLGLVICKKLVEFMGGTISATSQAGDGSVFVFTIPFSPSLKATREHARKDNMIDLEGKRVLVIEDSETNCQILMQRLKAWKMAPAAAASIGEAMEILAGDTHFDAVLADMDLPGRENAAVIKKQYPSLPIIGMSVSSDNKTNPEPGLFSAIILKPVRQYMLRDKLLDLFAPAGAYNQNDTNAMSDVFAERYPLRILVAEDNPVNQKIATKILAKLGYTATLANHGKEAMELVGQEQYDIILMDVQMPEMNGLEATRMIRTCLDVQPVIIALTANAMQGDRDECMQAGMDDYMSKPIQLNELLAQLEKWALMLKRRRA